MQQLTALAVCGPTSSGKSELASLAAAAVGGEIVNADSRQVYAGMRIGTGWPSDAAFARANHHLYGVVQPDERYSAGRFVADARVSCAAIVQRGKAPILVGGTGLYVEALGGSMPLDRPVADDALRERVRREAGVHPYSALREWLASLDAEAAARLKAGDGYRTLRALEVALARRDGLEDARPREPVQTVSLKIVVLDVERGLLRARIERRVRDMFECGLATEAEDVAHRWPDAPALSGIGYAEALAWRRGLWRYDEAVRATITRTQRYAKRQQTWFKRLSNAVRIDAADPDAALRTLTAIARESLVSA